MGQPAWVRSALVVDVDNTLFDWVHFWASAFSAMVASVLADAPGLGREELLGAIRAIHRGVGTSEYAFVLQDLRPVLLPYGFGPAAEERAIQAYRDARAAALELYPGAAEALRDVKSRGARIVGFTESTGFHTAYRLSKFGLDGVLDAVYSPPDYAVPQSVELSAVRRRDPSSYALRRTRHEMVPGGFKKPDPELLLAILAREGIAREDAVYVGDSIARDVAMAQSAGVLDAYAEYGRRPADEAAKLLAAVTHWTDDELRAASDRAVVPTIVLHASIRDVFEHVIFERYAIHGER